MIGRAVVLCVAGTAVLTGCGAQDGLAAAGAGADGSAPVTAAPASAVTPDADGLPCPASQLGAPAIDGGLPALTLPCLGPGPSEVTLSGLVGQPVLLNVWATWCPPCRAEMPLLAELSAAAGDRLTVLGVNVLDDPTAAAEFAAQVPLASVADPDGRTRAELGWTGPPVTYFVDSSGQVVHRTYGQIEDAATLRDDIRRYLGVEVPA
ncbi:MAG: cytochrome c biosis protein CcmG, thiol:disulfide interchange protein DsbE [Actinomycetota bacterium]|nr:cytochrome c biosis protein CcmG, thiol:disulfide interchange protein DsbE [Actinomycetota bacterium]